MLSLGKVFGFSSAAGRVLTLALLLAISAEAHTLAQIARQELERQARVNSTRVLTSESPRTNASPAPPAATEANPNPNNSAGQRGPAPAGAGARTTPPTNAPAAAVSPAPPPVDPVKEWNDQIDNLRAKIQELQDQETALQLQVNQLTNQIFAPVTDQTSRDQAQARLGETQNRLMSVRMELDQTRKTLDSMNLQGPPKK